MDGLRPLALHPWKGLIRLMLFDQHLDWGGDAAGHDREITSMAP